MYGFVACLLVFLNISLSTIFTWRIYSYTPVDARYFPKGGAVVEAIACDGKKIDGDSSDSENGLRSRSLRLQT